MRSSIAAVVIVSAAVSSCRRKETADLGVAGPDQRVALIELHGTRVENARWSEQAPDLVAGEDSDLLAVMLDRRETFADESGELLSVEAFAALRIATEDDAVPPGSCGRCLWPSERAPQLLMPGDRCAVPPFVEVRVLLGSKERFEGARERILIERPGACPCQRERLSRPDGRREHSVLHGRWPAEHVAVTPEGDVAMLGEHGLRVRRRGTSELVEAAGPGYAGSISAALGIAGSRVFASVVYPERASTDLVLADSSLRFGEPLASSVIPRALARIRSGEIVIAGASWIHDASETAQILVCQAAGLALSCQKAPDDALSVLPASAFFGPVELDNGVVVIATSPGDVSIGVRGRDGAFTWRYEESRLPELTMLSAAGGYLVGCAQQRLRGGGTGVFRAAVTADGSVRAHEITRAGGSCLGAIPKTQGGAVLLLMDDSGRNLAIDVDERGLITAERDAASRLALATGRTPARVAASAPGLGVVEDSAGALILVRDEAPSTTIYDADDRAFFGAMARVDSELWAVSQRSKEVAIWRGPEQGLVREPLEGDLELAIRAVAFDRANDEILVVADEGRFGAFSRRAPHVVEWVSVRGHGTSASAPVTGALAEIAPARFLVITDDGRGLVRWDRRDGERIEDIAIDWDLADTAEVEEAPACGPVPLFNSISASGGVGFVGVCDFSVLRIGPTGRTARFRLLSGTAPNGSGAFTWSLPVLGACLDQAIVGIDPIRFAPTVLEVQFDGARAVNVRDWSDILIPADMLAGTVGSRLPLGLLGGLDDLAFISAISPEASILWLDARSSRLTVRTRFTAAARNDSGDVLAADREGRLYLSRRVP